MSFRLSPLSLATGAVIVCLNVPAFAAEQQGWYLGAGAGYAKTTTSNIEKPEGISEKTNDTGFKLYGGYQFHKNWAAEIEVVSLGKYTESYSDHHTSIKTTGLGISTIGILPLSDQFSLFGKTGVIKKYMNVQIYDDDSTNSQKNTVTSALLGGGAAYHFTPNLTLRAEYEHFGKKTIDKRDIKISHSLFSLGMHYRF